MRVVGGVKERESLLLLPEPGTGGEHGGGKWFSEDHTVTESPGAGCQTTTPSPPPPPTDNQIRVDQTSPTSLLQPSGGSFSVVAAVPPSWNHSQEEDAGHQLVLRCWSGAVEA